MIRAAFSLMRYQPWWFTVTAVAWLGFHAWPLIPGVLAKLFFDLAQGQPAPGINLPTLLVLVAAAGLARVAVIVGGTATGVRWRVVARSLLQRNMLARTFELPGAQSVPQGIGATISTFRDDTHAISMLGDWVYDSIAAAVFIGGGVAVLAAVNAAVTLFVLPPVIGVVIIAHVARNRIEHARERSRATTANVTKTIGDLVSSVRAVQSAGKVPAVVAHLSRQSEERKRATLHDDFQAAWLDGVFANTASLGSGLTLLVAAHAMRAGTFTLGDFALFSTYLLQVTQYTSFIGYLARTRRQAMVALRRSLEVMRGAPQSDLVAHHSLYLGRQDEPETRRVVPDAEPFRELGVRGLTLIFAGSGRGIRDVSFTVPKGSLTVVTGRIGSGKTTLLRATLGLLAPDDGTVGWNGEVVASPATFLVPPRVAYTPQSPALLSGSIRDNILLGLRADGGAFDQAVRSAVLDRDLEAMPDGVGTQIGVHGVRLSGGQVQRTAAARMFVRQADLMVFDDLSSALDIETELELWRRLREIGASCLAVSHRRAALERADQIVVLRDGEAIGVGSLRGLLDSCPQMRQLYAVAED